MPLKPPCRLQCPHGPAPSPGLDQSARKKEAVRKERSDTPGNNSNVFCCCCCCCCCFLQNSPNLGEMSAMQFASFMPISTYFPQNPSCPKTLAFKTRHGPRGFQATCKKRKRHVTSSEVTRLHALLQLFSKTDGYYSQVLICPVPNWVPHQTNTRFATLDGRHALQTPMSATLPPTAPPLSPGLVLNGTRKEAGWKDWSQTLGNNFAVFCAKLTKPEGYVHCAVVILHTNCQLLS